MSDIVRHKAFGNPANPTIDYFSGYGGKIEQVRAHIGILQLAGFRVLAFEYDPAILKAGEPVLLTDAIDTVQQTVEADSQEHEHVGGYGMSLGTLVAANMLARTDMPRAMLNTGLVSMAGTLWHNDHLKEEKKAFVSNGHDYDSLARAWKDIEVSALAEDVADKRVTLMASTGDTYLDYEEAMRTVETWRRAGVDINVVTDRFLNHTPAIIRNFFRVVRTVRFYR